MKGGVYRMLTFVLVFVVSYFLLMFPYIFLYGVLHGHPPVLLLKVRPYLPLRLERKEFLP